MSIIFNRIEGERSVNLHEYQAKRLFAEHGIPIPRGEVAQTPAEARAITQELGGRAVVKSQVLTGGRGKAGGIKLAQSPDEAEANAKAILGMQIKGLTVNKVLVDELAPGIRQELYLAVLIDRGNRRPMIMASAAGGMDIEEVAETTPEKIHLLQVDPNLGVRGFQTTYLAPVSYTHLDVYKRQAGADRHRYCRRSGQRTFPHPRPPCGDGGRPDNRPA